MYFLIGTSGFNQFWQFNPESPNAEQLSIRGTVEQGNPLQLSNKAT